MRSASNMARGVFSPQFVAPQQIYERIYLDGARALALTVLN